MMGYFEIYFFVSLKSILNSNIYAISLMSFSINLNIPPPHLPSPPPLPPPSPPHIF